MSMKIRGDVNVTALSLTRSVHIRRYFRYLREYKNMTALAVSFSTVDAVES
jgi:hypothetical protein